MLCVICDNERDCLNDEHICLLCSKAMSRLFLIVKENIKLLKEGRIKEIIAKPCKGCKKKFVPDVIRLATYIRLKKSYRDIRFCGACAEINLMTALVGKLCRRETN